MKAFKPDPKLDLVLERVVDVPPSLVWACWTMPKHIKKWFTPAPWKTVEAQVDLAAGAVDPGHADRRVRAPVAEGHRAHRQGRDPKARASQLAVLHGVPPWS